MSSIVHRGDFSIRTRLAAGRKVTLLEAKDVGTKLRRGDKLSIPTFPDSEVLMIQDADSVVIHSSSQISKDYTNSVISVI